MDFDPLAWDKQQASRQASFFQSSWWGNFQKQAGSPPHYLMEDDWSCLLLEKQTALGTYLFAPYGPTLKSPEVTRKALDKLKAYGRKTGADWLRLEPMLPGSASASLRGELAASGARPAGHNREPDLTRIIDLTLKPDQILASVSQSTRSLIRKNQREKFLTFETSTKPADIKLFTSMLDTVTRRNNVYFFPEEYFQKEAQVLMPAGMMRLEFALQAGKPVASAIFHDFGDTTSYTYAASLPEARQTSASALLLWQAILNAKQRGIKKMDLFGIAPDNAPQSHPWRGFTDFKKKFGGEVVAYSGTWDIPLSAKYRFYRAAQTGRKILRRH